MKEDITSKSESSKTVVDLNELANDYDGILTKLDNIFQSQKDAWKSSSSDAFVSKVQGILDEGRVIKGDIQAVSAAANQYIGEMHNIDTSGASGGTGSSGSSSF